MTEALGLHVLPQSMVSRAKQMSPESFVIWDVGLGAAANAIAVLEVFKKVEEINIPIELHSFDRTRSALIFALDHAKELGYFDSFYSIARTLVETAKANSGSLTWELHEGDFRQTVLDPSISPPHAVMFDPYSPAATPELWNVETFEAIRRRAGDRECTMTSYSRATSVRVSLLMAGWFVGKGCATGEKSETTIAASHLSLLKDPLDARWIDRVSRSSNAGPLTTSSGIRFSSETIANQLRSHPQFSC